MRRFIASAQVSPHPVRPGASGVRVRAYAYLCVCAALGARMHSSHEYQRPFCPGARICLCGLRARVRVRVYACGGGRTMYSQYYSDEFGQDEETLRDTSNWVKTARNKLAHAGK